MQDTAGNLYGTTFYGGINTSANGGLGGGTVFKLDSARQETVLYNFCSVADCADGSIPDGVLIEDAAANLYGTTDVGGAAGAGTVFKLDGAGETVLYSFCSVSGCADGLDPLSGPLARDAAGNLYGTTIFGGVSSACNGSCGVVFKLGPSGRETVLHNFTGGADGGLPWAGLTMDSAGNLYGAAEEGGDLKCNPPYGCGTVFEITP